MLSHDEARTFLAERHRGVLVTIKRSDGRPQLSNVVYAMLDHGGEDRVTVSVTANRAKTANAKHDPRVSMHVSSEDFWTYVVAEGQAQLSPPASEPGDGTCRLLLRLYEAVRGEAHPDPEEFHDAMVADRRLALSFGIDYLYPTA